MDDATLELYSFLLCEMGGDCDYCQKETPEGEYFWYRTSYEYVEGDYYCRTCATTQAQNIELFTETGIPRHLAPTRAAWTNGGAKEM